MLICTGFSTDWNLALILPPIYELAKNIWSMTGITAKP